MPQSWPHDPVGSTQITDIGFNTTTDDGWSLIFTGADGSTPCGQTVCCPIADATATFSGPNVMKFYRNPAQYSDGKFFKIFASSYSQLYAGVRIKTSNPFTGYANTHNKLFYLQDTQNNPTWFEITGNQGGPFQVTLYLNDSALGQVVNTQLALEGNDSGSQTIINPNKNTGIYPLGQWNTLEVFGQKSTTPTSQNGILRWWLNGTMMGEYLTVNTFSNLYTGVAIGPAWDAADLSWVSSFHEWDHFRVTNGGSGSPPADTQAPLAPTGVTVS